MFAVPQSVTAFLTESGSGAVVSARQLTGGHANQAYRLHTSAGHSVILKQNAAPPTHLFEREAASLLALREAGTRTPDVLAVGADFLLLEDLGEQTNIQPDWAQFGRIVAQQHLHRAPQFGFMHDNFLGPLPQHNPWMNDGHAFFGQHRVLRYIDEPRCAAVLTPQDRHHLERLVQRLPELVPEQPPSLLHGDLWHTNMLCDARGTPSLIDPAVYYGWPEAELNMTRQYGHVPPAFFEAYNEVNPLEAGWWERLELLQIRQCMAVLAFFGNEYGTLNELRAIVTKFS